MKEKVNRPKFLSGFHWYFQVPICGRPQSSSRMTSASGFRVIALEIIDFRAGKREEQ